jgi:NADH dehydrogenase
MAMKTIPQSLNIRSLILENFEQAVLTTDVAEQNSLINFVLVADQQELRACRSFGEMKSHSAKDYPDLDIATTNKFDSKWRQILNTMREILKPPNF